MWLYAHYKMLPGSAWDSLLHKEALTYSDWKNKVQNKKRGAGRENLAEIRSVWINTTCISATPYWLRPKYHSTVKAWQGSSLFTLEKSTGKKIFTWKKNTKKQNPGLACFKVLLFLIFSFFFKKNGTLALFYYFSSFFDIFALNLIQLLWYSSLSVIYSVILLCEWGTPTLDSLTYCLFVIAGAQIWG